MDQAFIPECFVDTNLIETLVPPVRQYNHQKGCGTVTKVMREKFADRFAVGIIDKDKHAVDYLNEFDEVYNDGSLLLYKHKIKHHYIIQISPAMERFILSNANAIGISLEDYQLPSDLTLLKKESKTVNTKNDRRFKQLFKTLINNGAPEIQRLRAWIDYLKEQNYLAYLNTLRQF
jgi:hydrogenase maturation factor HypF (carbamoyltransferase family)